MAGGTESRNGAISLFPSVGARWQRSVAQPRSPRPWPNHIFFFLLFSLDVPDANSKASLVANAYFILLVTSGDKTHFLQHLLILGSEHTFRHVRSVSGVPVCGPLGSRPHSRRGAEGSGEASPVPAAVPQRQSPPRLRLRPSGVGSS